MVPEDLSVGNVLSGLNGTTVSVDKVGMTVAACYDVTWHIYAWNVTTEEWTRINAILGTRAILSKDTPLLAVWERTAPDLSITAVYRYDANDPFTTQMKLQSQHTSDNRSVWSVALSGEQVAIGSTDAGFGDGIVTRSAWVEVFDV